MRETMIVALLHLAATAAGGPSSLPTVELEATEPMPPRIRYTHSARSSGPRTRAWFASEVLEIFDENGKRVKTVRPPFEGTVGVDTKLFPSRHTGVIGILSTKGYRPESESWAESELVIIDADGTEMIRVKNPPGTRIFPSPAGDYAVGLLSIMAPGGPPQFFDQSGLRNKWGKGFGGGEWPSRYLAESVSFSEDGRKVALGASLKGGFSPLAMLFDDMGEELWRLASGRNPTISPKAQHVVLECVDAQGHARICLADVTGKIAWTLPSSHLGTYRAVFSSDESAVCIATTFGQVYALDVRDGRAIWSWKSTIPKLPNGYQPFVVDSIEASANLEIVALGGIIRRAVGAGNVEREADRVVVLARGTQLADIRLSPGEVLSPSDAAPNEMSLSVAPDGKWLEVPTRNAIRRYRIERAPTK